MGKRKVAIFSTILFGIISASSYLYYENIIIPERALKEKTASINKAVMSVSKHVDAFMMTTDEQGITYGEIFKSADNAIESIENEIPQLLKHQPDHVEDQLKDAIAYVRGCKSLVRHTKTFFYKTMNVDSEKERLEALLIKIKKSQNLYELKSFAESGDSLTKDFKKHTEERLEAAKQLVDQGQVLIALGDRGTLDKHSLLSRGSLQRGIEITNTVLGKDYVKKSPAASENERGIAGVIEAAGFLCHEALSVHGIGNSQYQVECNERAEPTSRATYEVNVRTGNVIRQ